jgi:hypothetical protein
MIKAIENYCSGKRCDALPPELSLILISVIGVILIYYIYMIVKDGME